MRCAEAEGGGGAGCKGAHDAAAEHVLQLPAGVTAAGYRGGVHLAGCSGAKRGVYPGRLPSALKPEAFIFAAVSYFWQ